MTPWKTFDLKDLPIYWQDCAKWPLLDPQWTIVVSEGLVKIYKQVRA